MAKFHNRLLKRTTMMAILPPTSPTTLIGGFSLAVMTGIPRAASMVRLRSVGGECRPSTMSDSALMDLMN
jgi:hypothetical protein